MINRIFITLVICFQISLAFPQTYGNEWIESNQNYYKIVIGEDGIYKISATTLTNAGFPSNIDPRKIQIFHRGQEIAILVEGENDGSLDASDYIQFYGEKNDGRSDTPLYESSRNQAHTRYNIFSDSSAYFLTYRIDASLGLRVEEFAENNTNGIVTDNYYVSQQVMIFHNSYYEGESFGTTEEVIEGVYGEGEGWTGSFFSTNQSRTYTFENLSKSVVADLNPQLSMVLQGGNNNEHNISILVGPSESSLRTLTTVNFSQDEFERVSQALNWSDISSEGELVVQTIANGVDGNADRVAISLIEVEYPKEFDLEGSEQEVLYLKQNSSNKSYISIVNLPINPQIWDITDGFQPKTIAYNSGTGNTITAIVPETSQTRKLLVQSTSKEITELSSVSFQNIDASLYDYLIISHPDLRSNTSADEIDPVQAYADYRESSEGGEHRVLVMNIQDIFEQFNYGLPSPLAIQRFCTFMYANGSPQHLFIIGKARDVNAGYYRVPENISNHFIPTFGHPGSDALFSEGLDGGHGYESIATGRINAQTPDHVMAYLNKVIEHEAQPFDHLGRKNLVQLSGGKTESELNTFKSYIEEFQNIADNGLVGSSTKNISKSTNEAVSLINISEQINEGVMMVTFFGHSSGNVTDIEIGIVSDGVFGYANKGKYPVFLINGCRAGDFFNNDVYNFGVDWILTPDLGAVGFMANSSVAFTNNLNIWTNIFYNYAFDDIDFQDKTLGELKMETSKKFIETYGSSSTNKAHVQLLNLQGDPAVKVFGTDKADFEVEANSVYFTATDNNQLLASSEEIDVNIVVKNYGVGKEDDLVVRVTRTFADGSQTSYDEQFFPSVTRMDTLVYTITNETEKATGQNEFNIKVDALDQIEELDETNNEANVSLFLASGSTFNLLPDEHSIVNQNVVDFKFQSTNHLLGMREFDFELDTIQTFDSPYLVSENNISANTIVNYNFDINSKGNVPEGTTFFWRTKFSKPLEAEGEEWVESSFTYISDETEGWFQQSPKQIEGVVLEGIELNENTGIWNFENPSLELMIRNYGPSHPTNDYADTEILLNSQNYFNTSVGGTNEAVRKLLLCRNNTINLLALKRTSTVPFSPITPPGSIHDILNNRLCGFRPQAIFNYAANELTGTGSPMEYIDALDDGDGVLIFSLGTVNYSAWSDELKTYFESLGISRDSLDNLENGEPMIVVGRKGAAGNSAVFNTTNTLPKNSQALELNETFEGSFTSSTITSKKIGPAQSWNKFTLNLGENSGDDVNTVSIIGINNEGNESILVNEVSSTNYDMSGIDADEFPFIKLKLTLSDPSDLSPFQLKTWKVNYETSPEGILITHNALGEENIRNATEGQKVSADGFTFWNISKKDFKDSLTVFYNMNPSSQELQEDESFKIAAIAANDSTQISFPLSTVDKTGNNFLNIRLQASKELYNQNNRLRLNNFLEVEPYDVNSILQVYFDGLTIMEGDIVSPSPTIEFSLDEGESYLLKKDTSGINIFLRECISCEYKRVSLTSNEITWQPASEKSDFKITYQPNKLDDGMYGLKAELKDGNGNSSGVAPYEINFEVINESSVTNFYPYPNPFSSQTKFVFTLTGSEIPEDIKIQIMTITGKIVKEIFMSELGAIHIGNNLTDYAWDGRDNYGDLLANGVYLYKVMIKNAGEPFKHRSNSEDRGFKNGLGKIYLLR